MEEIWNVRSFHKFSRQSHKYLIRLSPGESDAHREWLDPWVSWTTHFLNRKKCMQPNWVYVVSMIYSWQQQLYRSYQNTILTIPFITILLINHDLPKQQQLDMKESLTILNEILRHSSCKIFANFGSDSGVGNLARTFRSIRSRNDSTMFNIEVCGGYFVVCTRVIRLKPRPITREYCLHQRMGRCVWDVKWPLRISKGPKECHTTPHHHGPISMLHSGNQAVRIVKFFQPFPHTYILCRWSETN